MMQRILLLVLALLIGCPTDIALALVINGDLVRASLEHLAADPVTNLRKGRVYWNTVDDEPRIYNGSGWVTIADSASAVVNPMDSAGDVIVGGALGVASKLDHPGSANQVIKSTGASTTAFGKIVDSDIDAAAGIGGSKLDTVPYDCARETTAGSSSDTSVSHVCSGSKIAVSCGCSQSSSAGATALIVVARSSAAGGNTCSCTRLATPSVVMTAVGICCSP